MVCTFIHIWPNIRSNIPKNIIKLNHYKGFIQENHIESFLLWAMIGIIIGGRLGYVVFYNFHYYITNPHMIFYVWQGECLFMEA